MKIYFIFIGTFVLINVLKYQRAKYLLVDVGPDFGPGREPIGKTKRHFNIIMMTEKNLMDISLFSTL